MVNYTKEQLWKLYEKLPPELKEAVFSADNADYIYDICSRNSLAPELNSQLARLVGNALLGLLLPGDFQKTIEKELKLEKTAAKKVAQEVNRLIFFPVKGNLSSLNKIEFPSEKENPSETQEEIASVTEPLSENPPALKKSDTYREKIE